MEIGRSRAAEIASDRLIRRFEHRYGGEQLREEVGKRNGISRAEFDPGAQDRHT